MLENLFNYLLPAYGIIIELNLNGDIIDSYHDLNGKIISKISEVLN